MTQNAEPTQKQTLKRKITKLNQHEREDAYPARDKRTWQCAKRRYLRDFWVLGFWVSERGKWQSECRESDVRANDGLTGHHRRLYFLSPIPPVVSTAAAWVGFISVSGLSLACVSQSIDDSKCASLFLLCTWALWACRFLAFLDSLWVTQKYRSENFNPKKTLHS